ncbi:MAG: monofunctional biosynthetic peptidoglycan transglycosylase [Muribaculaceae bacterium]|nr:monofunctional biosynthetic peptidoglycan transglycosylase [Muribaculaceae bacterium]
MAHIGKAIGKILGFALIFFVVSSILSVVILKWLPVYYTPLMLTRSCQKIVDGEKPKCAHEWVPLSQMSHNMPQAVMASEDNLFLKHHGFDWQQIKIARKEAKQGKRERGASTISQQTAKNVFLWNGHSWVRKGLEAYFTVLIELIWGKERIMEVYLNSIEMGEGIYGAQAVAKEHFNTTADKLTRKQSATIAATLPNPLRFNSAHPSNYIVRRSRSIMNLMNKIEDCNWGKK